ncbi:MAG: gamma-glutamyltransferase [Rhodocyclales bacterium]|nr:gamma-glutamyltransferase [Rhodocyclales bacterium]
MLGKTTGSLRAARFCLVLALLPLAALAQAPQPEATSGYLPQPAAIGRAYMAVTANPHATEAAVEILQLGGNALDAAIAAQWVLNLVEPQSSGVGGGGFLLHWDSGKRKLSAWDGRETAPRSLPLEFGRRGDGSLLPFPELLAGGNAVGVPGLAAMLEAAHRRHGKLKWERLLAPAIRLAENGFAVSPRLHSLLRDDPLLRQDPAARALYFQVDGRPLAVGSLLRNPELATVLRRLATGGSQVLHRGPLAERIVTELGKRGGRLTLDDLRDYRPRQREAVCGAYRRWRICGMPPPSSGGIAVLQILGLVERSGLPPGAPVRVAAIHHFAEAGRLAFADRARYLGDPDFVAVPTRQLLASDYLGRRARLIHPGKAMDKAMPGKLASLTGFGKSEAPELPATTHLSIIDQAGNAVSMTSSIEAAFGSRIQVEGFLLNNQLTDFSLTRESEGLPVANRAEPGKRPLSSMSPTLVFDAEGKLFAVLGSPGGSRIINYVARTLMALLDGDMDAADALQLGHVGNRNGATEVELGRFDAATRRELELLGHRVQAVDMTSGLHVIVRRNGAWVGAADPRREGLARGG